MSKYISDGVDTVPLLENKKVTILSTGTWRGHSWLRDFLPDHNREVKNPAINTLSRARLNISGGMYLPYLFLAFPGFIALARRFL